MFVGGRAARGGARVIFMAEPPQAEAGAPYAARAGGGADDPGGDGESVSAMCVDPIEEAQPESAMYMRPNRHADVWTWLFSMQPELRSGTRCGVMSHLELALGESEASTSERREDKVLIHFTNRRVCILWLERRLFDGPLGTSAYDADSEDEFKASMRALLIN